MFEWMDGNSKKIWSGFPIDIEEMIVENTEELNVRNEVDNVLQKAKWKQMKKQSRLVNRWNPFVPHVQAYT